MLLLQRYTTGIIAGLLAALLFFVAAPAMSAEDPGVALSVYNEGKRSYDAGDYPAALHSFNEAAKLEPGSARWQYNIGLTHNRLSQLQDARTALLAARQLDPEYKREEIDKKLISMGFDASGEQAGSSADSNDDSSLAFLIPLAIFILLALCFIGAFIFIIRKAANKSRPPQPSRAAIEAQKQRLLRLGPQLVAAEHALQLGEDHDLRALLDRATELEHSAYSHIDAARSVDAKALKIATGLLDEAEPLAKQIQTRIAAIEPAAISELGSSANTQRAGCFFCARPLANAGYRRIVPLHSQQGDADVLACPPCADKVARGEAPETVMLDVDGSLRHWSEAPGFDPYQHRHMPHTNTTQVPAWRLAPTRSFADLALLAAGGALGLGAAYAATQAFDLDAASKIGLAKEAARNAAERAGRSSDSGNSSRDFS